MYVSGCFQRKVRIIMRCRRVSNVWCILAALYLAGVRQQEHGIPREHLDVWLCDRDIFEAAGLENDSSEKGFGFCYSFLDATEVRRICIIEQKAPSLENNGNLKRNQANYSLQQISFYANVSPWDDKRIFDTQVGMKDHYKYYKPTTELEKAEFIYYRGATFLRPHAFEFEAVHRKLKT